MVLDVTLWGYLEHYLYYELQEEVTLGRVRDERRAGQLMLDHTTVVSAKLCFLLVTFTSQVKWELCAYRVDSIDQLRKEIIDLTRESHAQKCEKSASNCACMEKRIQSVTLMDVHTYGR